MPIAYLISGLLFTNFYSGDERTDITNGSPTNMSRSKESSGAPGLRIPISRNTASILAKLTFVVVFGLIGCYQLFKAKDLTILANRPIDAHWLITIVSIAVILGTVFSINHFPRLAKCAASALLATLLGTQLGITRSQAVVAYPITYHYGQSGFNETVAYLQGRVEPGEAIWSMKDIGHYVNKKYIENYSYIFDPTVEARLEDLIKLKHIRYFVVTTGIGQDRIDAYPEFKQALDTCCIVDKEFGNFVIYKAKVQ